MYIYIYILYINANTEGNVYIRSDKSSQRKGLHILYWALIPEGEYQYMETEGCLVGPVAFLREAISSSEARQHSSAGTSSRCLRHTYQPQRFSKSVISN